MPGDGLPDRCNSGRLVLHFRLNQDRTLPWSTGQYLPYFYHAGLYVHYPIGRNLAAGAPLHRAYPQYNLSSDGPGWGLSERVQTVEQVIQVGYFAVPQADPVTAILSDRHSTSRLSLDDVISQIRHRYQIYDRNVYELNQAVCEVHNSLFRQLAEHGLLAANERQQYSATKQVQKLYEQQRQERTDLWRDVSRLRLALPEAAQNYLAAYRKISVLESRGDEP